MKKTLAVCNLLSVLLVIVVNGLSQVQQWNNTTVGEISQKYGNLFTPASYAFSIWSLIFLALLAYALFQIRRAFFSSKPSAFIKQTAGWFTAANVLNASWVVAFTFDYIGLSALIMVGILCSLLQVIRKTNMERWDAPIATIAFVWWPICLYAGWIAVAMIANVAAFLVSIEYDGAPFSELIWTYIMITIAVAVNLFMIFNRNMREFALVGVWALVAIFVKHRIELPDLGYYALVGAIILLIANAIHGYRNRSTAPHIKLKQRLQNKS